jgi:DNA-binding response OmpR family regulator
VKVLIADDDRILTHLLTHRLRARGFDVSVAFDAMQAWMAVMRTLPDALVLDIQMPGGTGVEVLRKVKSSARTSHIPVVVVSGSVDVQTAESVKDMGADAFLSKPVDVDSLCATLSRLLGTPGKSS